MEPVLSDNLKPKKGGDIVERKDDGNLPKCPTCGSTNIEKISTGTKVGAAALFGLFALAKISKTFKCRNCGYQW